MLKTVTIADGRKIVLDDLDAITPEQGLDLATGIADFLVRSGQIKDDVALSGPHLLQFLSEAADMAAQQAASAEAVEEGRIILKGRADTYSSKRFTRYVQMAVSEPYNHEVRFTVVAKPGQTDDDLTVALAIMQFPIVVNARLTKDGLECTTDDITRLRP